MLSLSLPVLCTARGLQARFPNLFLSPSFSLLASFYPCATSQDSTCALFRRARSRRSLPLAATSGRLSRTNNHTFVRVDEGLESSKSDDERRRTIRPSASRFVLLAVRAPRHSQSNPWLQSFRAANRVLLVAHTSTRDFATPFGGDTSPSPAAPRLSLLGMRRRRSRLFGSHPATATVEPVLRTAHDPRPALGSAIPSSISSGIAPVLSSTAHVHPASRPPRAACEGSHAASRATDLNRIASSRAATVRETLRSSLGCRF
ncbi:hypothetical protein B0H15DRAFT_961080 [Mycena belliarum]|uniref:Uncharacterized protein n=1 Tax=Mycena belliarum TaxID=1033014 RepID=A0AAD6UD18_9AGAR|nr:hypothetical protein B0H15DRAFT_961080 [Mycena belliae]